MKATILQASQGLSQIIYTTSAPGWVTPWVTVNSGFRAGLALTLPATIDSGTVSFFSVQFVDEATGKRVTLDAPTSLVIEATSAEIRHGNGPWSRDLTLDLLSGANSSPVLELRPNNWPPRRGERHPLWRARQISWPQGIYPNPLYQAPKAEDGEGAPLGAPS